MRAGSLASGCPHARRGPGRRSVHFRTGWRRTSARSRTRLCETLPGRAKLLCRSTATLPATGCSAPAADARRPAADATARTRLCSNSAVRSLSRARRSPARSVLHAAHRLLLEAKRPFGRRLCRRCGWLGEAPGASVRRGVAPPNSTRLRRPPGFPLRSCSLPYSPLTGPSSAGRGDAAVILGTGAG